MRSGVCEEGVCRSSGRYISMAFLFVLRILSAGGKGDM